MDSFTDDAEDMHNKEVKHGTYETQNLAFYNRATFFVIIIIQLKLDLNTYSVLFFFAAKTWITRQVSVVSVKPRLIIPFCDESRLLNMLHSSTGNQQNIK